MAQMGLKYMAWAPIAEETDSAKPTYKAGEAIEVGRMVSLNVAIKNAEGEIHANDMLAEYASEFSSADLSAEVDNISLENQAKLYGAKYSEETGFEASAEDTAPYGGVGGYRVLMVGGKRIYQVWIYVKAKAVMPDIDSSTKGSSISFGSQPIKMKVTGPKFGPWYKAKDFLVETEAKKFVDDFLGLTAAS